MTKVILQMWIVGLFILGSSVLTFAADENTVEGPVVADEATVNNDSDAIEDDQAVLVNEVATVNEPVVAAKEIVISPEKQAMMARMQEYSTPNQNHQVLAQFVGEWHATVKVWMDPKGEPEVSQGTSVSEMTMGGRFLQQIYRGQFMNQKFEGTGIYGYDNLRKEFRSVWYDNMATGMMVSSGQYDSATKTLTDEGTVSCPITNGDRWFKAVTKVIDTDHYIYETFMKDEKTGEEFLSMQIDYTRVN